MSMVSPTSRQTTIPDERELPGTRVAREFWEMGHNQDPIPTHANEALVRALKVDPDDGVREQVAKALASNRLLARQNRSALDECADGESGRLRDVCLEALGLAAAR